jgi:dTDP-glucose 4,6-dehydratase
MKRIPIEDLEHIFQNTQDIWESFRGKSIFLTGGTGFFGKWLLESFIYINIRLGLNAKITSLSRNPDIFLKDHPFFKEYLSMINFVKGDVLDYEFNLEEKYEFIIHAATEASESLIKNNPLLMIDTITIGTKNLLNFALKQKLEGFLFVSSGAIYGKQPVNVSHVKESDSFKIEINESKSAYAEGKRIAELYCSIYFEKYNIPVKIARCFAFVGPYLPLNSHFAIGNFINDVIVNKDIIIKGDGSTIRSYMYASDLTICLWRILLHGKLNQPYNVGSDELISIKELAEKIKYLSCSNVSINILGSSIKSDEVDIYCPSILKGEKINSFRKISFDDSIKKTLKFYKTSL